MRGVLIVILFALLTACSHEPYFYEGRDRPDNPQNNQSNGKEENEPAVETDEFLNDESIRLVYAGIDLNADKAGVLYTVDKDFTRATLRDISTGDFATYSVKERNLTINGLPVAYNLSEKKVDESKGIYWWKGTDTNGKEIAIVLKRL